MEKEVVFVLACPLRTILLRIKRHDLKNLNPMKQPIALTIAGSDPSGGAGIQADLKTFHQFGIYGASVITLLTIQNTLGVREVIPVEAKKVLMQLEVVLEDITPGIIKTGALGNEEIIVVVANRLKNAQIPLIIDPVMKSKHGSSLLGQEAIVCFRDNLLPHAFLVTPNLSEAEALLGQKVASVSDMEIAAEKIAAFGPKAVLIKGGHLSGESTDVLFYQGKAERFFSERIDSKHTHGTGCTLSAAIAAQLAAGKTLREAVLTAKKFVTKAIQTAPRIGRGQGPLNHHVAIFE